MTRKGRYKEAHARANAPPVQDHSLSAKRPQYRLGVDVGGTHTDLVLLDSTTGQLLVEKVAIACASATHQSLIGIVGGFYPTVIRGNGVGYATGMGRFGAILGPVIAG